jgi:hypothetical protein
VKYKLGIYIPEDDILHSLPGLWNNHLTNPPRGRGYKSIRHGTVDAQVLISVLQNAQELVQSTNHTTMSQQHWV